MTYTIKDIAKELRDNKKRQTPFVIFTGAGCSRNAGMPLAGELVAQINKKYKANLKNSNDEQKRDYGHCMSKLSPADQKDLLTKYVAKSKINWAHLALASLLKDGYISKVLTFNFDNILNRACSLDNFFPPIYDLKVLDENYFSLIPNQSIVHLHGQWSGFELANSTQDTSKQADKLKEYIKTTLTTSPSLFIGYSGGADAFFKLVEENFIGQHRLFWVDYSKEANLNVSQFINHNSDHRNFLGEQDADRFLIELATELKCFPSDMFKKPFRHMLNLCEGINEFPLEDKESQINLLEDVKASLNTAQKSKPALDTIKILGYLQEKKFDHIIQLDKKNDPEFQNNEEISKLFALAYVEKSIELIQKNRIKQSEEYSDRAFQIRPKFHQGLNRIGAIYGSLFLKNLDQTYIDKSISYLDKALKIKPDDIDILNNYGNALKGLAQLKQDAPLFEKAFEQYEKTLKMKPDDTDILNNYGNALKGLAQLKQDAPLFEKAFEQYEKALKMKPDDTDILYNYGNALKGLAQLKQDAPLFEKAFEQYAKALKIKPDDTDILNNYGSALQGLAQLKQDALLFEKAFEQYAKALKIKPDDTDILNNDGSALQSLAQLKQDAPLFEKAFEQYEKALKIKPDNADIFNNYGNALKSLAQLKQDAPLFEKAFEQFQKALKINPKSTYNLACHYSLKNDIENCKTNLLNSEQHNTLPATLKYINDDKDLDNVRNEQWFQELLARIKLKEQS